MSDALRKFIHLSATSWMVVMCPDWCSHFYLLCAIEYAAFCCCSYTWSIAKSTGLLPSIPFPTGFRVDYVMCISELSTQGKTVPLDLALRLLCPIIAYGCVVAYNTRWIYCSVLYTPLNMLQCCVNHTTLYTFCQPHATWYHTMIAVDGQYL